jgi:hypothetical protein
MAAMEINTTTYTFTRAELVAAFRAWDMDRRDGKCMSHEEADATPPDERAECAADSLLRRLAALD